MKQRGKSTWCTRPHIHLLSTHTRHVNEASFNFAGNRDTPSGWTMILHNQYLKNGAPYCCKHIDKDWEMVDW